jgi:5-formyltetrahydrofolate cyclo-ligase
MLTGKIKLSRLKELDSRDEIKEEKQKIRERIWKLMEERNIATFPGAYGRIPNFIGAEKAAEKLRELEVYKRAKVIFVNPDSPQRKIRENALKDGKVVIMPTPKLKEDYFLLLNPKELKGLEREASSIKGAFKYGKKVKLKDLPKIDLKIQGSVAVDLKGTRLGKGGGYGDKECAMLVQAGKSSKDTPLITTVHETQIVDYIPREEHDFCVDYIITPKRVIKINLKYNLWKRKRGN